MRTATVHRATRETDIRVTIELDGTGKTSIATPLPFLSHMVDQIGRHGLFDLTVEAKGDVEIDGHHTTEDLGIVLGQAVAQALGDRRGIQRYGWSTLPMDEARSTVTLDLGGRTFFDGSAKVGGGYVVGGLGATFFSPSAAARPIPSGPTSSRSRAT